MSVAAYPLAWPPGWPRTPAGAREDSRYQFKTASGPVTFEKARGRLAAELDLLRAFHVVLSTNIPLRLDGQPRSDAARMRMEDPGVAVYFTLHNRPMVMAQDRFDAPSANIRSLGLAIEAMRQLERHGGGAMMERAFAGFAALPRPRNCWEILGVPPGTPPEGIKAAFRAKAMESGAGGNVDMGELAKARDEALRSAAA